MRFSIYRYNPETDEKPRMQDYDVALEPTGHMLLDALIRIKEQDDSLAFRRSCREGVCGSDGMNINGKNGLACITKLVDLRDPVVIRPLPGLPVIRDLIVDMSQFFKQYHSIKPYLVNDDPPPVSVAIHSGYQADPTGLQLGSTALRCDRLCRLADPGQILVSQATQALLVGTLADAGLRDLGERTLLDEEPPLRVFAVSD